MQARSLALVWILSSIAASAQAVRVTGEPAPAASTVRQANPASASAARPDGSNSLREGIVTSLSTTGDRVEIQGTWLKIVDGQTRIYQGGRPVSSRALQPGAKIRFTMAAASAEGTTLGVIYVP
jgi:hypothetical protein